MSPGSGLTGNLFFFKYVDFQLKKLKNEGFREKIEFSPKIHIFSPERVSELRKHLKKSPDLVSYPPIITAHYFRDEFMKS